MLEATFSLADGWDNKSALQATVIDKSNDGGRTIETLGGVIYWKDDETNCAATPPMLRVNLTKECAVDSINITSNAKFIELYINSGYISTLKGYSSEEEKYLFGCSYDQRTPNVKLVEFKFLSLKPNNKELNLTAVRMDVSPTRANDAVHAAAPIPADMVFNFKKFDTEIGNKLDSKIGNGATLLGSMLQSALNRQTDFNAPPNIEATRPTNMNVIIDGSYYPIIDKMIDAKLQPLVEQLNRIEQTQLEILKRLNV